MRNAVSTPWTGPSLTPQPPVKGSEHDKWMVIPVGLSCDVPPRFGKNWSFVSTRPSTNVVSSLLMSSNKKA